MIISAILALVVGIVVYFVFIAKPYKKGENKFVEWLHNFLNFKTFFIEMVLKTLYVITTVFITLSSFCFIGASVATFFLWLILGNIINRVVFELILMMLTLVNNTTEINKKIAAPKKDTVKSTPKKESTNEKSSE